ncbi:DUF1292 domain-containing protein [Chengkuizengella sediminis]|uniref:DUF1292 domain-containing protein n=1 Tax=Chengkuizengella sediminis TaxID=1885917 RepID=UPI001389737B|nr:DUF1292 domain-containing protein [Chengkuizengella sediminis]NDI33960.1 DUF1292 domain-containing protein [Chengkuizengella sediminis]
MGEENNNETILEDDLGSIFIKNDEGEDEPFEIIMQFEVHETGAKYMMVVPENANANEDEEVDEVYPFRYEEDGDDLKLFTIDDDEEWNLVEETFNTLLTESDLQE